MTALDAHIAAVNRMDSSLYLGRLAWYTVSDMRVSHGQVLAGLLQVGLGSYVPPMPRDHDVFRRVSTNAQVKRVPVAGVPNVFENYLLREIQTRGENLVTKRVVVERVDKSGKKLDYRQLRDVIFDKKSGAIQVSTDHPDLVDEPNVTVDVMVAEIQAEFLSWRGMLNSYAIREFTRKMLMSWGATPVRDGLYFVPEEKAADVESLEQFILGLSGNANFHSMPLVDNGKQREMVRKAFEADTVGAIDTLMGEIREINSSDKQITTDRYAAMLTEYQTLLAKTGDYKQLLAVQLGETESRLSLFQSQIVGLRQKVKQ